MRALAPDELAVAAGTSTAGIARLSELGLHLPLDADGLHPLSNLSRIRLLLAHEANGVSVDAFADVSGYTKIAETAGDEVAARAATSFAMLVDDVVVARGGRRVKLLGDGAMLAFDDAAAAVRCALELVGRAEPEGLPPIHVGLDAGPVVRRDGDYFGSVVNIASRVANRTGPRQVLVTGEVATACRDAQDLEFVATGPAVLKNVAGPVTLHLAGQTGRKEL